MPDKREIRAGGRAMTAKLLEFAGDKSGHLTPAQAAEFIPRHVGQIRTMCETGEIEAIDISTGKARRWKIQRSAIRAWLVNHNNQTARRSA